MCACIPIRTRHLIAQCRCENRYPLFLRLGPVHLGVMKALYANDRPGQFPKSWYAATATPAPERPALFGERRADVCVIGAGYTGLIAALELRAKGFDVVVVEAHRAGWGASGRNGGQVETGFSKGQLWLEARVGKPAARVLWDLTEEAKDTLRALVATHAPEARYRDGVAQGAINRTDQLDIAAEVANLRDNYDYHQIETVAPEEFRQIVGTDLYQGGSLDKGAGHIHPLRYAIGLARAAEAAGVTIYERSEVHEVVQGQPAIVRTGQGRVRADHVIVAGNGYLPNLFRPVSARVMPVNSFIGATKPLGDLAQTVLSQDIAVFDAKQVVNYFRLSEDGRLLFGGRANYSIKFPKDVSTLMLARVAEMFPQIADTKFDFVWGGTLGVTANRLPNFQRLGPNILWAGGYSGQGVAMTAIAGRLLAEATAGTAERFDVMAALPSLPIPGGTAFRAPLLALGMTWANLRDRLGI